MSFIYDLADTWNNAATSFNGIKLNVTDTASAVTSKLVDLQIGSVSKFSVSKTGAVTAAGNIQSTSGGFTFPDGTTQITRAVTNVTATDGSIAITGTTDINLSAVYAPKSYSAVTAVRNNSGATLTKGTAVYMNGAIGQNPTVTKAIASGDATSAQTLGLIAGDISNNANGEVIIIGTLYNIDTSAYADGQQLYLSPTIAGALTATKPYAPSHLVYMAIVEHAHPTQGKLFVKVQNGYEMDELHNVAAQNPANNDGLFYNTSTNLWEKKSIAVALGYTPYNSSNPAGYITASAAATTYQPLDGDLTAIAALAGTTGIVRKTAANTYTLDTASYITGITSGQVTTALGYTPYNAINPSGYLSSVSLTTNVTGTLPIANGGTGETTAPLARTALGLGTAAILNAGVASGVATLDGSGTVPTSQLPSAVLGGLNYQGTWNASTNTPALASSTGSKGYYYVTSVAGSTNLNGITDWKIGDWAVYDGAAWQKVDNTDAVSSVNGYTGTVVLTTSNVAEGTNLYFTQAAARGSVSAGTGISYNSTTGVITNSAPDQTVSLTGAGTATVTGTYPNFTITATGGSGTVSSVAASGGTTGLTFTGSPITTSGTLTLGGTLGIANGGTNLTSYTTGDLLYASAANTLSKLPIGTQNYSLVSNANIPTWSLVSLQNGVSGTLGVDKGGTGNTSYTTGALLAFGGTSSSQIIPDGTSGYALKSNGAGSFPSYGPLSIVNGTTGTLMVGRGGTGLTTCNPGDLLYASAANTLDKLPIGANGYVLTSNGATLSWQPASGGGGGGVTSFSGGTTGLTPSTATTGAVTLAGTLSVANGGTGKSGYSYGDILWATGSSFNQLGISGTYGQYLKSNGSQPYWSNLSVNSSDISWNSTVQPYQGGTGTTSSPINGQILIGSYGNYSTANITAGANITITNGPGSITIAASGGGGGGPTIDQLYLSTSMGSFYNSGPGSGNSRPLVGYKESGPSIYGAFVFNSGNSGYSSYLTVNSMQITDSGGGFSNYTSGPDFYASGFNINGNTAGCYGINLYSTSLKTLFEDSSNALDTNSLKPVDASSGPMSQNPSLGLSMSGGPFYNCSSGNAILVAYKSGSTYYLSFAHYDTSPATNFSTGYDINAMYFNINGSMQSYNLGSDYTVSFWQNTSEGQFTITLTPTNSNLTTLLDNSAPGA